MNKLLEELKDELGDFGVTVEYEVEDETIEIWLKNPSSELYDEVLEAIEEMCDDAGFSVDGDYEGRLSVF